MRIALLLGACLSLAACKDADTPTDTAVEADADADADTDTDTDADDDADVDVEVENPTWTDDVRPILANPCGVCHSSPCSSGVCFLDDYQVVHDSASYTGCNGLTVGACMEVLIGNGKMPPGSNCTPGDTGCISAARYATLQNWVDQGMPE